METKQCPHHEAMKVEIENLKDADRRQWEVLEKVENRLPNWATLTLSILSALLAATAAAAIGKVV